MLGSSPSAASCHHALRALSAGDTGLMTCHQDPRPTEVPLPAGRMTSGIVRRGDRLLRPMGPWSPAVHEYLRHLEAAGFEGSPRVLGIEGDRHGVTVAFIDWDAAQPVDPLADLASAAWAFMPLAPARQLAEAGFDPLPDLPARLRLFLMPTAGPIARRSWPRSGTVRETNPNRCAGSRTSRQTSLARYDDDRHASGATKTPHQTAAGL